MKGLGGIYLISVMSFLLRDLRAFSAESNAGSASSRSWFRVSSSGFRVRVFSVEKLR